MNNLYLIIGEDYKLIDFYLSNILNKTNSTKENKITYDLNTDPFISVLDESSMISLFNNPKLIIANNFDLTKLNESDIEYLKKYLQSSNKTNTIILIASKIDARKTTYKILKDNFNIIDTTKCDNNIDIFNYLKEKIHEQKYKMTDNDINYFISKVGNDLNNINSELTKLFIYKEKDKVINSKDIDLLIIDNIDNIIYEFTNAIIENDYNKVVSMYQNFKIQNVSIDYLIAVLSNNFHQLLTIKILKNEGKTNLDISKVIGKKEFYVKKVLEKIYQYTTTDLASYITKLAQIDRNFKSGQTNIDELELFIISK